MAETRTKTPAKKRPSAKEVATTYFAAVRDQDVEGMASCWRPGSIDRLYGMADLRVPEDLQAWFGSLFRAFPDFRLETTDIRVTVVSPGLTQTELTHAGGNPELQGAMREAATAVGIDPSGIAQAIGYAIDQPAGVDVNEIIVRPTASVLG